MMKLSEKKEVRYTVGALGLGVLLYSLYKMYRYMNSEDRSKSGINSSSFDHEADVSRNNESMISNSNEHTPYE